MRFRITVTETIVKVIEGELPEGDLGTVLAERLDQVNGGVIEINNGENFYQEREGVVTVAEIDLGPDESGQPYWVVVEAEAQ